LLSLAQESAIRVLHAFIHNCPKADGTTISELTIDIKTGLASRGEPSGLNERKVGDVLTSLGLTNRSRKNIGYVLWLDRSDRVRIHEMARDYEVDGVPAGPIQNCEICAKKERRVAGETSKPKAVDPKQVPSDEPKREHRERREHRSGGGNLSTAQLYQPVALTLVG
jgi:hypothetical protein